MVKEVAENLIKSLKKTCDLPPIENVYTSNLQIEHLLGTESFEELNIHKNLVKFLYENNFDKPAAIQSVVIPNIIKRRSAVVQADSGSGKTLAFLISALEILLADEKNQVIILAPTRELTYQIENIAKKFTDEMEIKTQVCLSGVNNFNTEARLFIGTPGSVANAIRGEKINKDKIELIIFDEGDRLLDYDSTDAKSTLGCLNLLNQSIQLLILSATYSKNSEKFIEKLFQSRDVKNALFLFKKNSKPKEINLYNIKFEEGDKMDALLEPAYKRKEKTLVYLLGNLPIGQAVVFAKTRNTVNILAEKLRTDMFSVSALHGQLEHESRIKEIEKFRKAETKILITTDVLSRGIDIPQINLVINYDLPNLYENNKSVDRADQETYIHRVGRAGRFGRSGFVIDFISGKFDEKIYADLKDNLGFSSEELIVDELKKVIEDEEEDLN